MVIHDLEQNTEEWHNIRKGLPTASQFKSIITSAGKPSTSLNKYAAHLAAELFIGEPVNDFAGNQWTERGHELEQQAKSDYSFVNDIDVYTPGFVTSDNNLCGCSPDGFVGSDGLLEIKSLKTDNHVLIISKKNKLTDYYAQVQGQLFITQKLWCDLIFYHPKLPVVTIRVKPDLDFFESLEKQINETILKRDLYFKELVKLQDELNEL